MERRNFILTSALSSIALSIPAIQSFGSNFPAGFQLPKRKLGKTGEKLSVIGFGGIMLNDNTQDFANEIVAKAWEMGCNYYDVAPSYGNAETKLGPALKGYRKKAFLACKTTQREAAGAEKEMNASFKNLETDWFDLYQLHALTKIEDVEKCFAPGGMMEVVEKAKKEGKIRFVGFSAHSVEAALLAMSKYDFDTVMFPINFATWHAGDFGPQVYQKAVEKNMGILALKAMALTRLKQGEEKYDKNVWYRPVPDEETMKTALKFTLSKDVTAAIPPGKSTLFLKAIEFMKDYKPITTAEEEKLISLAKETEPLFRYG
jgi:predicted aldo/keto reductase-like oxidoreductase